MNRLSVSLAVGMVSALSIFSTSANAQDEEVKTLFGSEQKVRITGSYAGFSTSASQLNDGMGFLLGARGGIILNNAFLVGLGGNGLLPTNKVDCPILGHDKEKHYLTGGYGGLFFEYINSTNSAVHFTANMLVGLGGVTYTRRGDNNVHVDNDGNTTVNTFNHPRSFVAVFEPGVAMDLNVTKAFRMSLGVSYRYSPNFKLQYEGGNIVPKTAFNGFSVNLTFKFGNFSGTYKPPVVNVPAPVIVPPVIIYP